MVPGSIESRSQKVTAFLHKADTVIVGGGQAGPAIGFNLRMC
jgi:peptidase E